MQKEKTPEAEIYKPIENSQKEKINQSECLTLDPSSIFDGHEDTVNKHITKYSQFTCNQKALKSMCYCK